MNANKLWDSFSSEKNFRGITLIVGILTTILLAAGFVQVHEVNLNLEKINDLTVQGSSLFHGDVTIDNPEMKGGAAIEQLGDDGFLTSYGCISLKVPNSNNWVNLSSDKNSNMQWLKGKCEQ